MAKSGMSTDRLGKDISLPLNNKIIYIDTTGITKAKLKKLEEDSVALGARIEKFFTKDVNYLITKHAQSGDYKSSNSKSSPVTDSSSTLSPFAFTPSAQGTPQTPTELSSTPKPDSSRGHMMLRTCQAKLSNQKSQSSMANITPSQHLIENAKQFNVTLLHPDFAASWLSKKLHLMRKVTQSKSETKERSKKRTQVSKPKEKIFRGPYLKIDDNSQLYRPNYKQFDTWELPIFDTSVQSGCPFEIRPPAVKISSEEQDAVATDDGAQSQSKGKAPASGKKAKKKSTPTTINQKNNTKATTAVVEKKKMSYCVICKVRYDNLAQHVHSDQHREFADNENNYVGVDKLINNGFGIQRFLCDVIKYREQQAREGLSNVTDSTSQQRLHDDDLMNIAHRSVSDFNSSYSSCSTAELQQDAEDKVSQELQESPSVLPSTQISVDVPEIEQTDDNHAEISKHTCELTTPTKEANTSAKSNAKELPSGTPRKTPSKKTPTKSVQTTPKQASKRMSKQTPKRASKRTPKQAPKQTPKSCKVKEIPTDSCVMVLPKKVEPSEFTLPLNVGGPETLSVPNLPLDISYSIVESVADSDNEADASLVESIISLTQSHREKEEEPGEDPLISCDNYINRKISQAIAQKNTMLEPPTPKKSPRHCLGARDWTDEHYSPQKQRLASCSTPAVRRVPKLSFKTRNEDKENVCENPAVESLFSDDDVPISNSAIQDPSDAGNSNSPRMSSVSSATGKNSGISAAHENLPCQNLPVICSKPQSAASPRNDDVMETATNEKPTVQFAPVERPTRSPLKSCTSSTANSANQVSRKSLFSTPSDELSSQAKCTDEQHCKSPVSELCSTLPESESLQNDLIELYTSPHKVHQSDLNRQNSLRKESQTKRTLSRRNNVKSVNKSTKKKKLKHPPPTHQDLQRQQSYMSFGSQEEDFLEDDVFGKVPELGSRTYNDSNRSGEGIETPSVSNFNSIVNSDNELISIYSCAKSAKTKNSKLIHLTKTKQLDKDKMNSVNIDILPTVLRKSCKASTVNNSKASQETRVTRSNCKTSDMKNLSTAAGFKRKLSPTNSGNSFKKLHSITEQSSPPAKKSSRSSPKTPRARSALDSLQDNTKLTPRRSPRFVH